MNKLKKIISKPHIQQFIILGLLISFVFLQIAINLGTYLQPFRKEFMYNLYYHSQWVDPESKQSIGDDGLYQVAGNELVKNNSFFIINPEVPPLGKYFYGVSITLLGNAEKGALLLYIISLFLIYLVSRTLIQDKRLQLLPVLFFATDALIFYQSTVSMLDLPLLIALLIHILAMNALSNQTNPSIVNRYAIIAGLSFGAFMAVKIGFFGVFILIADAFILFKKRMLTMFVPILIATGILYLSTYSGYFLQGYSLIDFAKAQKWMLHFYLSSSVEPVLGTVFSTLLLGKIIGWNENDMWKQVAEWSPLWTVSILTFLGALFVGLRRKSSHLFLYLIILAGGMLLGNSLVPFFTRYLVLVLPLLYCLSYATLENLKIHTTLIIISSGFLFIIHYYLFWQ